MARGWTALKLVGLLLIRVLTAPGPHEAEGWGGAWREQPPLPEPRHHPGAGRHGLRAVTAWPGLLQKLEAAAPAAGPSNRLPP